ncbi:1,2-phenylacetyl-CoA epoxidase subunit PaaE [Caenimonas terrae]|uniref:1,2-phenylacetyl-CoA epoxidase subunit PaaE n=1 Tax=Caenimonas terrae TaxID=696074 RepID=A0ABW0NK52_9BURK
MAVHFHPLRIARVSPEAAGAVAITFAVPAALRAEFDFLPGQFLTLRTTLDGKEERRSYSICSPRQRFLRDGEIEVGIKPVDGGRFSRWAVQALQAGESVEVLPPQGRFTPKVAAARHRVGFAAGSGITPLLSIIASTLEQQPDSSFTLVYGNQRMNTIMFNEALQDLKDRYPARLTLLHLLSRQPQETALLNGRIDQAKVDELLRTLLPVAAIDEAFLCGPEGMIDAAQAALLAAGLAPERVHAERFHPDGALAAPAPRPAAAAASHAAGAAQAPTRLQVVLDGKTHSLAMGPQDRVLDVALEAGLDLPYSCKGGVCCTCRARILEGRAEMERNYTLEPAEIEQGFVLTCQARPLTSTLTVSYDER